MAEFVVGVGADVSALQLELQKAENALRQFEAQARKSTDIGELAKINTNISSLRTTISGLQTQMSGVAKPTGDATNALMNLSRVAQDAPYGFMGIANNLNPMLESFQRLQKESGSTGGALKAIIGGLTGPAGLGVALGVVSSLVVAFGDEIGNFFSKLSGGSDKLIQTNKAFHDSKDAFANAYVEMINLGNAFDSFHNNTKSKKEVLDEYNNTLGKVYGSTQNISEAEKVYIADKDKYVQAAMYRAAAQLALKKAAEEAFKQQEAAMNPQAFGSRDLGSFALSKLTGTEIPSMYQALGSQNAIEKGKKQESIFLGIAKAFNAMVEETNQSAEKSVLFGKDIIKDKKTGKGKEPFDVNLAIKKRTVDIGMENPVEPGIDNAIKEAEKKHDEYLKWLSDWTKSKQKLTKENYIEEQKDLKESQEQQKKFADYMANEAVGAIRGMWDALKSGQSVMEALGNSFLKLAEDIGFAILKAEILAAINAAMGVTTGGVSTAAGGTGILTMLSKLLGGGMASGGIVTSPTLTMVGEGNEHEAVMPLSKLSSMMSTTFNAGAMSGNGGGNGQFVLKGNDLVLALQRSNYNLNLRRG